MPSSTRRLPRTLQAFEKHFPRVWTEYCRLRDAADASGPLPPKMRELIKVGIEAARRRHGGLVAHMTRAKKAGASREEIYQAILIALPLIGLPDTLEAFIVAQQELG